MSVTGTFTFSWSIRCANWSTFTEFSSIGNFAINFKEMWLPKIMHYNSVNSYYLHPDALSMPHVIIFPGKVDSYMIGIFTSKCEFRFKRFPFDSQKCNITLESFGYSDLIILKGKQSFLSPQNSIVGDYTFDYSKSQVYSEIQNAGTRNYSFVAYEFHFSRKSEYYVINIIIPIISMMTLEHAALLIPISSERCSFLLTILLSIFLIQSVVDGIISHLSETPRLAYLLLGFTVSSTVLCLYSIAMLMLLKCKFTCMERKISLKFITIKIIRGCDGFVFILSVVSSFAMTVFTFQTSE